MLLPVRGKTPPVTVYEVDFVSAAPFMPVPRIWIVCTPAVAFDGIVTVALTTPLLFTATVCNSTGSDRKKICA